MVRIDPCHGSDPGSIPGSFVIFFLFYIFLGVPFSDLIIVNNFPSYGY